MLNRMQAMIKTNVQNGVQDRVQDRAQARMPIIMPAGLQKGTKRGKGAFFMAMSLSAFLGALIVLMAATPARAAVSLDEEQEVGLQIYNKFNESGMLVKNAKINRYIDDLGNRILSHTDEKNRFFTFKFAIVKSPIVNAFATPGGFVYINRGLITLVDNEAELAGVIAHEIAHVMHRHIASQIEQSSRLGMATLIAALAGALLGGDVGGIAAISGLAATSQALILKYSREHEEDADRVALRYLAATGYTLEALPSFLRTMNKFDAYSNFIPSYMLTHPGAKERLIYLEGAIALGKKNATGAMDILGRLPKIQALLVMGTSSAENNLKYFEEKLFKNSTNPYFNLGAADAYLRMGQTDKARAYYERTLAEANNDSDILREVGIFKYKTGALEEAIAYLKYALDGEDDDATRVYLGQAFLQRRQFDEVLNVYANLDEGKTTEPEIFNQLALAYGNRGDNGASHYYFGIYFENTGKREAALFHYEQACVLLASGDKRLEKAREKVKKLSSEPIRGKHRQQ